MPRPLILDANSLIVRHVMATALKDLKHGGVFTGGVYSSTRVLRGLVAKPEWLVGRVYAFFDRGVPEYRLKLLPDYKSERKNRREMLPEDEKVRAFHQIEICFDMWPLLGVTCLCFEDREADDGVAAAARLLEQQRPVVVSSDRDLYQCVSPETEVFDLGDKAVVTWDTFEAVTGVPPEFYVLYRALVGDSSDSIPGAKGCGPKRAAQMIVSLQEWAGPSPLFGGALAIKNLSPPTQCEHLALYLAQLPKRRGFEEAALLAVPWLQTVCRAVDLRDSWGGTQGLSQALEAPSKVDPQGFLRAAREVGLNSILGDPQGWLSPFRVAQVRVGSESPTASGKS